MLSTQALKIKDRLLELHNEKKLPKPLDLEEIAAIRSFNASGSWSGKIARENGWMLQGGTVNAERRVAEDEISRLRGIIATCEALVG